MSTPVQRPTLPVLNITRHGSRSLATCLYRCGNACDKPEPNTSGNEHISTVIEASVARRRLLQGAAAGGGALVIGGLGGSGLAAAATAPNAPVPALDAKATVAGGRWKSVQPNKRDMVSVPPGYRTRVVAAWGDPVVAGAPTFDPRKQTPEAAAKQFGYNNDYIGVVPLTKTRALLVCNHEYTNEELMFPEGVYDAQTIRKIALASHGLSIVLIERANARTGAWKRVAPGKSKYNRRITGSTKFKIDGPAAGDPRLRTSSDPSGTSARGTLNNCAGGMTPWGTILSGEENFNQYFGKSGDIDPRYADSYARLGITGEDDSREWRKMDKRFDLSREPHEPFRFGWIVEIDPKRPKSTPRKHTMLGRFKHEGANIQLSDSGHAVAYMGDDERGDYLYKFVSAKRFRKGDKQHNMTLLTEGTLYVARLAGDGTADGTYDGQGTWLKLTTHQKSFVPGMSVADVLIDTRLAADKLKPTRMDRPEDVQPNPVNGKIYAALTNNSQRGSTWPTNEPNPIGTSMVREKLGAPLTEASGNRNGYVLEIKERKGDHTGTRFFWNLMLVCGDPEAPETYFAGFPKNKVNPISCPDNVAFDSKGNLWISTDGNVLGSNDGLFRVPVSGPSRGHVKQFLTVPRGAETCGPLISHNDASVWVAVQHPGEGDGSTFASPHSTWPHTHTFPRPGVVVTWKRA